MPKTIIFVETDKIGKTAFICFAQVRDQEENFWTKL